jgi:hypothetical protein
MSMAATRILLVSPEVSASGGGVAGYTRRLAAEAERRGCTCLLIGLSDRDPREDSRCIQMAGTESRAARISKALEAAVAFRPDRISVQMSPYGLDPRGLAGGWSRLAAGLASLAPTDIFLHELWIGINRFEPLAKRLMGRLQRAHLLHFLRRLKPGAVWTSNHTYLEVLSRAGVRGSVLTLFGNIPIHPDAGLRNSAFLTTGLPGPRDGWLAGGVFGSVYPGWDGMAAVRLLGRVAEVSGRRLAIVGLGRIGPLGESWIKGLREAGVVALRAPPLDDAELSRTLAACDVALASTPWALAGKSSSSTTWREHGVPVITTHDDWDPGFDVARDSDDPGMILADPGIADAAVLALRLAAARGAPAPRLAGVADIWLEGVAK